MAATRVNPLPILVLLGAAVAILVLASLPRLPRLPAGMPQSDALPQVLPDLTEHALAHPDAREAYEWTQHHGAFCRYECPDGRTRFVCPMAGNRWAVVVLGVTQRLITAFKTDQDYARGIIDQCRNPWRMAHP